MSGSEAFMSGHELLTGSDRVKSSKKRKQLFFPCHISTES